jgi:hypothetical protein
MPNFIVTRLDLALARQHIFFALVPLFLVIGNSATLAALPGPVSTAAILNSNANTDSGFDDSPDMVTDGLGTWVAVWESNDTLGGTLSNGTHIFTSRSTDGGATWSALAVLGTEGLRSRIATDGNGTYIVV